MGVDLTFLPISGQSSNYTVLPLERRTYLFGKIRTLKQFEKPIRSIIVPDFGILKQTPYGESLKYTTVKELLTLSSELGVIDNHENRAIWAYLSQLPIESKIALFWS